MKGLFIPEITAEMFRNGCLEGIEALMAEGEIYDIDYTGWIPVSERLPEEKEWIGTKKFGTTISDKIVITFEAKGHRFVRVMRLQNGDLGPSEKRTMDVFYEDWRMIAWMPLPIPYREESE